MQNIFNIDHYLIEEEKDKLNDLYLGRPAMVIDKIEELIDKNTSVVDNPFFSAQKHSLLPYGTI